jgi:phenylalanyl-tRNA synthetase beta chain
LRLGPSVLAYFGEIHPAVAAAMKRDEPQVGFEVFLQEIPQPKRKGTQKELLKPSPFQPLGRDFAFILDENVTADALMRAVRGAERKLVTDIEIFDVYQGRGVDPGKKSVGVAVTIQPVDKTLTDEEIASLCKKIIEAVAAQTGGVLRG